VTTPADLIEEVGRLEASEVVVVTEPQAVEDTFHTDWASKAPRDDRRAGAAHVRGGLAPGLTRTRRIDLSASDGGRSVVASAEQDR
jgi:hypothetical protein